MRQTAVWLLIFSATTLVCMCAPPIKRVSRSFFVHVTNDFGPVAGLKLRVSFFKSDEFRAAQRKRRSADPKMFEEIVAEASTDETGTARFNLDRAGKLRFVNHMAAFDFTVHPETSASPLDFVVLEVFDQPRPPVVEVTWPPMPILKTAYLRGRLSRGLFSSPSTPVKQHRLKLHRLLDYREVADTTTGDDGAFEFKGTAPGFYFLQLVPTPKDGNDSYDPGGNIAVLVAPDNSRDALMISTDQTPCGLSYDLDENKARYKPEVCLKDGRQVECDH